MCSACATHPPSSFTI
ncbi:hypothetical protein LINPERPRIM_LOCUS6666 [Linum perenne]